MPDTLAARVAAIRHRARIAYNDYEAPPKADIDGLIAAVEAVLELHRPEPKFRAPARKQCRLDRYDWPCSTIEAITRALTGTEPDHA